MADSKTSKSHADIDARITSQVVSCLEAGVKPWTRPCKSSHAAGAVTRLLRHNGGPYAGINVLTLWCSAMERGGPLTLRQFRSSQKAPDSSIRNRRGQGFESAGTRHRLIAELETKGSSEWRRAGEERPIPLAAHQSWPPPSASSPVSMPSSLWESAPASPWSSSASWSSLPALMPSATSISVDPTSPPVPPP